MDHNRFAGRDIGDWLCVRSKGILVSAWLPDLTHVATPRVLSSRPIHLHVCFGSPFPETFIRLNETELVHIQERHEVVLGRLVAVAPRANPVVVLVEDGNLERRKLDPGR